MSFDAKADAEALHKILHAEKVDEDALIEIIGNRILSERLLIAISYFGLHKVRITADINEKLKGNFSKTTIFMFFDKGERDARFLEEAMKGFGTDEKCLDQILTTHTKDEIIDIKKNYQDVFGRELEKDVKRETSLFYKQFLVCLLKASRNEDAKPNRQEARKSAEVLYGAGEGKFGTDEKKFIEIFSENSFDQLRFIFEEYNQKWKHDIAEAIEKEFSFDIKNSLLAEVEFINNKNLFFAKQFHKAMVGPGTDDKALIRLVITLEDEMKGIKKEYQKEYKKSLADDIGKETSGSYGKLLLQAIAKDQSGAANKAGEFKNPTPDATNEAEKFKNPTPDATNEAEEFKNPTPDATNEAEKFKNPTPVATNEAGEFKNPTPENIAEL